MENHSVESKDTHQSALGTSAAILVDNLDPKVDEKLLNEKPKTLIELIGKSQKLSHQTI